VMLFHRAPAFGVFKAKSAPGGARTRHFVAVHVEAVPSHVLWDGTGAFLLVAFLCLRASNWDSGGTGRGTRTTGHQSRVTK